MSTELPFIAHLTQFGEFWHVQQDGQPIGISMKREKAIDLALRLSRDLVSDHTDPTQFRLEGADSHEIVAGVARLRAWLDRG